MSRRAKIFLVVFTVALGVLLWAYDWPALYPRAYDSHRTSVTP